MTDLFSVKDKTVVITGGSGYLGSEWCRVFEEERARVVNWDLPKVDVTSYMSVGDQADALEHIDVLIVGAAQNAPHSTRYDQIFSEDWVKEMDVNLFGAQVTIQQVAPSMMQKRHGSIILISSELALIGPNNDIYPKGQFKDLAYITSKTALLGLMRGWASYLGEYHVRVNALCPGGIYKDQPLDFVSECGGLNMLGRMGNREEMNGPLLFLASDASSFMTGATLVVDGGRTAW